MKSALALVAAALATTAAGIAPLGTLGASRDLSTMQAPAPTPTLRVLSPANDTYVGGPVLLRAVVEPMSAVQRVTRVRFFVDGNKVCELQRPPFECEWDAGAEIDEHTFRVTATFDDAFPGLQLAQTVRTRKLDYHERVDVDVVQVPVVVTDGGRFVQGLRRDDFKVFENNVQQRITHFASENIPLELVAALDVSGSMENFIPSMKAAAKRFQAAVPPKTPVMIYAFNENVFRIVRRSFDPAERALFIDRLQSWGGTALYDAIIEAIDSVGRQPGRRAVIIFSDGEDQSSHATEEAAIRRVEGSDATVYTIGQGRAADSAKLQKILETFASVSGGRAFFTQDLEKLEAAFKEIIDDLSHQYLISYPPPEARPGAWRRIKVEMAGGYRVRARQGYRLTKHN
ncbi:MAG: VWA domain-containing protein [Vicinamibacterales bacterium]